MVNIYMLQHHTTLHTTKSKNDKDTRARNTIDYSVIHKTVDYTIHLVPLIATGSECR